MESANLHHQHQLQPPQLVPSSSLTSPSTHGAAAAASPHAWTQHFTLSNVRQKNETSNPPLNSLNMMQDLDFHWNGNNAVSITNHEQQIGKIKQELTDSFPKFSEMLNSTSSSINHEHSHLSASTNYIKDDQKYMSDLSEKLLFKTLSSGFPINGHQFSPSQIYSTSSYGSSVPNRGNFSQIYPSVNISNLNRSPPPISSPASFDVNLQALDLLTATSFGQPCHAHSFGIYKDTEVSYNGTLDRMHHSSLLPSCNPSKISSAFTTNEISEAKRPNMELKAAEVTTKKSRLESRASCPPFKVRKEKLGDRIAALQQLVAPFGKTDTASVLMEAIGYIKFLQNQVETLSVPYMKSSSNKNSRLTIQAGSTMEEGNDEPKKDLRSRGLCLVPLSCMSYVTSDGGGGIWPPPNFGGGT